MSEETVRLSEDMETRVWRTYFRNHVRPELLSRFRARWIEVGTGNSEWSVRRTATTVKFDRTGVVRLTEALKIPFPCLEGEAEYAAIVFGLAGERREGYSRRWSATRAGTPFWKCWHDHLMDIPCRTLVVYKYLAKFVQEASPRDKKRRRVARAQR